MEPARRAHTPTPYTPRARFLVSQVHVLPPNGVCTIHDPPGGCTKNLNSGPAHVDAVAVKVTLAPGAWGDAMPGVIDAAVQPPIEKASISLIAGTKTLVSPVAGVEECVSAPVVA